MSLQNPKPSFTEIYFENLSCILLAAVVQQLLSKGSHSIRPDIRSSALDSVSPRSGIKSSNRVLQNQNSLESVDNQSPCNSHITL